MFHETVLTGLAWFLLLGYIATTLEFLWGQRLLQRLENISATLPETSVPKVSVIIPARNEEKNIEEALTSVLSLDYPNYEIIVLNDRSEDTTGQILERMSQQYAQLKIVHIDHLPDGWLGKNHAMYYGAQRADGDFLLFTDADVLFDSSTLRRAINVIQQKKLDHLALFPGLKSNSFALQVFVSTFSIYFSLYSRPWFARFPKLPWHIGIGAFNMLNRDVYNAIGTHQAIALRPDDDMKLGKLVKKYGYKQDVLIGQPLISVEWYSSLREMVRGLMKNSFSGLNYSLLFTILSLLAFFLFGVWPLIGLLVSHGQTQMLYFCSLVLMQFFCLDNALYYRSNPWTGPFFPLSTLLMMYIVTRATVLTYLNRGIFWRGTYYSLAQLRSNQV